MNAEQRFARKVELLKGIKGAENKRHYALNHLNVDGNEWVALQVQLGMLPKAALNSLSDAPRFNPPLDTPIPVG